MKPAGSLAYDPLPVTPIARFIALALLTAAWQAQAAGGHHDVDDATVLAPGRCQVEAWLVDGHAPRSDLAHLGPACRVGAVEWGLNADRIRLDGKRDDTIGPQGKWVVDLVAGRLAVGASLALTWRTRGPGGPIGSAVVPATAWVGPLQINVNAGRDHDPLAGHFRRWGIGVDWTPIEALTFTAERRSILGQPLSRAGLRFNATPATSLDLSVARGGGTRWLGIGVNWEWVR
jgi:hypothetical protein